MSYLTTLLKREVKYDRLPQSSTNDDSHGDSEEQILPEKSHRPSHRNATSWVTKLAGLTGLLLFISGFFSARIVTRMRQLPPPPPSNHQTSPRFEWRSLSDDQKLEYISAVQCLRYKPSRLGLNQSLYDDFPWVHAHYGDPSHSSAAFLAWHRYFIRTFERTLQTECGYAGELPYWDWTLDWQSINDAPVWNLTTGFGGSGNLSMSSSLLDGHCVTTGPFANLEVLYVKTTLSKHCLSRGILPQNGLKMDELSKLLQPSTISNILANNDYNTFNLELEHNSHNAIPRIIRGDFLLFTAPYDPVFYLHHAQLDRLWSIWQNAGQGRTRQYDGLAARNSSERARVQDLLDMGGLTPAIPVSDVLDTRSKGLGYFYL